MSAPHQPSLPDRARSHGRIASSDERRRVAITRRSTKGPLDQDSDIDDPLSPPPEQPSQRVLSPTLSEASPTAPHDAGQGGIPDISKDFSFIQDPSAYHVLPATNVPTPFLNAPNLPPVSTPIETLLHNGYYRLAAVAAARYIVQSASPTDYNNLFYLLHIRLACLCLISEHALAAQESKVLGDLNSAFYRHPLTNAHLVPWDLRLLVVRLAALGYGEWRKGVMGYYELARECRENIVKTKSEEEKSSWRTRLRDCGIRVANVLVEMGELQGAARHLSTLSSSSSKTEKVSQEAQQLLCMEALVWLRVGDIRSARRCLSTAAASSQSSSSSSSSEEEEENQPLISGTLTALTHLANSEYSLATTHFQTLHSNHPSNPMITQNLAVCLLYTGHISEARELLTQLADTSPPFHSLVFNLSTIYELCTERNRERKLGLAEKLAGRKAEGDVGWEVMTGDFKL